MNVSTVLCTTVSLSLFRPCEVFVRPIVQSHGRSTRTAPATIFTPSVHNLEYRAHYLCELASKMGGRLPFWCRMSRRVSSGPPRRCRGGRGRPPPRPVPQMRVQMYTQGGIVTAPRIAHPSPSIPIPHQNPIWMGVFDPSGSPPISHPNSLWMGFLAHPNHDWFLAVSVHFRRACRWTFAAGGGRRTGGVVMKCAASA